MAMSGVIARSASPATNSKGARPPFAKSTRAGLLRSNAANAAWKKGRPESGTIWARYTHLHDEPAERVADEDRGLIRRGGDRAVVIDELADAEPGERRGIGTDGLDRQPVLSRPC